MIYSTLSLRLRSLAVWLLATGVATTLATLLFLGLSLDPAQPFESLLPQVCDLALLGCLAWAWLSVTAVAIEAWRAPSCGLRRRPLLGVPLVWRRIVLGACGVALSTGVTAPALATPGPVHLGPQAQAVHPAHHLAQAPHPAARHSAGIVVARGDSLWRLTAERLGPQPDAAQITASWHRLYDANHDVIGEDPDVIRPGQQLRLPREW